MKANVYSLKGKTLEKIELPGVFATDVRPDIIKRAVIAAQSHRLQPWGPDPRAGKRTSAFTWGPGRGVSRLPRVKGSRHHAGGRVAFVPQAVGGRKAHPPMVERRLRKKINVKERRKATASAIAATAKRELVEERGHVLNGVKELPLVVTDDLEKLSKTKEVRDALMKLGIWGDVARAEEKKVRAGKGKRRGRKYKQKKSVLLVVSKDRGINRGSRNHLGVDVVDYASLGAEHLAPGAMPGRLTLYTKAAIEGLGKRFE